MLRPVSRWSRATAVILGLASAATIGQLPPADTGLGKYVNGLQLAEAQGKVLFGGAAGFAFGGADPGTAPKGAEMPAAILGGLGLHVDHRSGADL